MQQPGIEVPASVAYLKMTAAKGVMVGDEAWISMVLSSLARYSVLRAVKDIMKHPDSGGSLVSVLV